MTLGRTDLKVSPLAWGMSRFKGGDLRAARACVDAALESGITFFDTADKYGPRNGEPFGAAEALLGRVLAEAPGLRSRFILASKGGIVTGVPYDSSPTYLRSAVEASLTRMGVEQIDLYQIHRPDLLAHPAQVAEALDRLHEAGKIAAVGVSNHTPAQTQALQHFLPFPLASTQIEFSALAITPLEDGTLDQAMEVGLSVMAWSPLAGGRLGDGDKDMRAADVCRALDEVAASHGVSRPVAAYAWLLAHPSRPIPIVGSQQPARIAEAAKALEVKFDRREWYEVLVAARGRPMP